MTATGFEKVVEFNEVFGIEVYKEPQRDIFDRDPELVKYRIKLIEEEVDEMFDGIVQDNIHEIADADIDSKYVIYGMGASFGINLDEVMRTTYKFDASKTNYQRVFELCKDSHIPVFDTPQLDVCKTDLKTTVLVFHYILDAVQNLKEAVNKKDFDGTELALVELLYSVYRMSAFIGIDADRGMALVHDSNMSKSCKSEEEAKATVENYLKNDKRYDSPAYRQSSNGKYWIVFCSAGIFKKKILKNINYKPVNLTEILEDAVTNNNKQVEESSK